MAQPEFKVSGIVLDTPDPRELAGFYSQASSNSHHNIRGDGAGLPPIEGCWWRLLHQLGAVPRGRSGPTGDPRHQAAWTAGGSHAALCKRGGFRFERRRLWQPDWTQIALLKRQSCLRRTAEDQPLPGLDACSELALGAATCTAATRLTGTADPTCPGAPRRLLRRGLRRTRPG